MSLGDGVFVDGSWELSVLVADLQLTRRLRVRDNMHVGGLMLALVEAIDVKMDWSDHALWWPEKNCWLLKTRQSVEQCGLQAGAQLEFQPMHGFVRLELPDLQERELRVSFAKSVFSVTVAACKELGIRHPEELSLKRPTATTTGGGGGGGGGGGDTGTLFRSLRRSKPKPSASTPDGSPSRGRGDAFNPLVPKSPGNSSSCHGNGYGTLPATPRSPLSPGAKFDAVSPASVNSLAFEGAESSGLANSPPVPAGVAFAERGLQRARTFAEKAALSEAWLDSSKSLMEQGLRPDTQLQLRYKFHAYYDLNTKYDAIRINQIFEQAKWSMLSEEVDCTEEEMLALAALQLQVRLLADDQRGVGDSDFVDSAGANGEGAGGDDEIDAALEDLERSLLADGASSAPSDIKEVPELTGFLKLFKPKRFTLKQYKKYFCVLKETTLLVFADSSEAQPTEQLSLKGAEVAPDVSVSTQKFGIRLWTLGQSASMQELWLRCETKDQFASWMAALRLAARGKTLASKSLFDSEVSETLGLLELQSPRARVSLASVPNLDVADFVPPRLLKKYKPQQLLQKILERHANAKDKSPLDAKVDFIRMWQRLPAHGVAYFSVHYAEARSKPMTFSEFRKEKQQKEELVGVSFNKISRLDPATGETLSTWRYHELVRWTVNWEVLHVKLVLNRPPQEVVLTPLPSACPRVSLCKTLAEFIGGYVFLSLRSPDRSQELDEGYFHRLTGSQSSS